MIRTVATESHSTDRAGGAAERQSLGAPLAWKSNENAERSTAHKTRATWSERHSSQDLLRKSTRNGTRPSNTLMLLSDTAMGSVSAATCTARKHI